MRDDLAIDYSFSIAIKKILALSRNKRDFLSVDLQNEVKQIFFDRRAHLGKKLNMFQLKKRVDSSVFATISLAICLFKKT